MFDQLTSLPSCAILRTDAFDAIVEEVATGDLLTETGGILLGRPELGGYLVSVAGGPGPNAIHEPDYFLRDLAYAQSLAMVAWTADRSQWIGDWHTHPRGSLRPSAADLRTYRQHLTDPELGFASFLSVIGRRTGRGVALAAWAVTASHLERIQLIRATGS
jgi:integrative and conjugative element protein (TIGR02256 family)